MKIFYIILILFSACSSQQQQKNEFINKYESLILELENKFENMEESEWLKVEQEFHQLQNKQEDFVLTAEEKHKINAIKGKYYGLVAKRNAIELKGKAEDLLEISKHAWEEFSK
jgi:predicted patatin/cPLA2 family phospholipase